VARKLFFFLFVYINFWRDKTPVENRESRDKTPELSRQDSSG
jgi:hypothetical protein